MTQCNDQSVKTHNIEWQPQQCVDGGIFRAKKNYTNILASGFNTNIGYSGHYYGIRKYSGLIPQSAYNITLQGKTGDDSRLTVPREIHEIEYGSNNNVDYSGIKLVNDSFRVENGLFGKSISACEDYLAVGVPNYSFQDSGGYQLDKAGTILMYKRYPEPSGLDWSNQYDKGGFYFDQQINLPSGFLRDYVYRRIDTNFLPNIGTLPLPVKKNVWKVGQDGRQFGYSLDLCITDNLEPSLGEDKKNVLVVGGPSCKWNRSFTIFPSGIGVCLFVFTDNFLPPGERFDLGDRRTIPNYDVITDSLSNIDLLYRYYCDPPTKFNIGINIIECLIPEDQKAIKELTEPKPTNLFKYTTTRHYGFDPEYENSESFEIINSGIFSTLQRAFFNAFPYDNSKLNNNIPPIVGFFIDDSLSFGGSKSISPALDRFISFYKDYSFASGLTDFFGVRSSGYSFTFNGVGDNWVENSVSIISQTLSLSNLQQNNTFRFFANNIGQFNTNAPELNDPPDSGGRVYVFEKESGSWNLIQTIESQTQLNDVHPDRFGHDVKISDNGEIILVGSPYTSTSLFAYEYDPHEKIKVYNNLESWLLFRKNNETNSNHYANLYNRLLYLKNEYSNLLSSIDIYKKMYLELSSTDKYKLRTDFDFWGNNYIKEYKETFTFSPSIVGSWSWFTDIFAPNSRLGYSVAVNEDGSIIAAGAPTDSLNEFDDSNVYFSPSRPQYTTWHSYVNTGSVRVFESRKYFPHDTVIEYGKFGNLEYETSPVNEKQFFAHMSGIYKDIGLNFIKTDFADVDLPENAGLAFIITPQVDALSEEILTNIKNWLALGDRNLVLVGNDPIWENDGLYFESNKIINKILNGLGCRVIINPARNSSEALLNGNVDQPNITSSFKPERSFNTYVGQQNLVGSGVGDIKPYLNPSIFSQRLLNGQDIICNQEFTKTKDIPIPIRNFGDLRSQWKYTCGYHYPNGVKTPYGYIINWPWIINTNNFDSFTTNKVYTELDLCPDEDVNFISPYQSAFPFPSVNSKRLDSLPILTVGEYPEPYNIIYPAIPSIKTTRLDQKIVGYREDNINEFYQFNNNAISSTPSFIWSNDEYNYSFLNSNITNVDSDSLFYTPLPYNNKKPILQANASSNISSYVVDNEYSLTYTCARYEYANINSKAYLLCTTSTEDKEILRLFNKQIAFYFNIVAKDSGGNATIAQLGDFTGRTNFTDLNENSALETILLQTRNSVDLNVSLDNLLRGKKILDNIIEYDVCFILEPIQLPTQDELNKLKEWINRGNKKVIILYNSVESSSIDRITTLCEQLSLPMRPLFLPSKGRYAQYLLDTITNERALFGNSITMNNTDISQGFTDKNTQINSLSFLQPINFVPIELNGAENIAYFNRLYIYDNKYISFGVYQLNTGIAKVTFPALPGSGYKIFFTYASENINENKPFNIFSSTALYSDAHSFQNINLSSTQFLNFNIQDFNDNSVNNELYNGQISLPESLSPIAQIGLFTSSRNTIIPIDKNEISFYVQANNKRFQDESNLLIKTYRLIGISGCLVPLRFARTSEQVPIWETEITEFEVPGQPEQIVTIYPTIEPLKTNSEKYTPSGCKDLLDNYGDIEDGPIVVAQEFEVFSDFEFGVNRSRITIISDSSLIQGKGIVNSGGVIRQENINFLQSLYPFTTFPSNSRGRSYSDHITKIQAPERLTPQRLFNSTGNTGHNLRFEVSGVATSGKNLSEFIESFNDSLFIRALPIEIGEGSLYIEPFESPPPKSDEQIEAERSGIIISFKNNFASWGGYSKFAGIINNKYYEDSKIGTMPNIMKDTGYDYLDFDQFPSGYPGDLFGYSIDIYKNKILIGSPFAAYNSEQPISWSGVINNTSTYNKPSGTILGYNGGAGSVYLYERSNTAKTPFGKNSRWGCSRKFRPDSINIGQDTNDLDLFNSGIIFGNHNYKADDLSLSIVNDRFGNSVRIYSDIIAIGAPGHDFENYTETIFNSGAFIKKEFSSSLDIPQRTVYNLGNSGIRSSLNNSGIAILNNGAIFVYENRLSNWIDRKQNWEFVEKIVPQGFNSRKQKTYVGSSEIPVSGSENDYFGSILHINKTGRTDSDYAILVGTPLHKFGINNSGAMISNAGAVYIYDGILRYEQDATLDKNGFINARVFGEVNISGNPNVSLSFVNNVANQIYESSGVIYSNINGDIFLEASGQDLTDKIYIRHRPYITSINGEYVFGTELPNNMSLFIDGQPSLNSGIFNLFSNAANSAIVYNQLGLYQSAILDFASGVPSGLSLYTDCPSGIVISESGFALYASGTGFYPETLDLRVRGK